MAITVYREGDEYAAIDDEVDTAGFGATEEEARAELASDTVELHHQLSELGAGRLGPHMIRILATLNERARCQRARQG